MHPPSAAQVSIAIQAQLDGTISDSQGRGKCYEEFFFVELLVKEGTVTERNVKTLAL